MTIGGLLAPPKIPEGAAAIRTRRLPRCEACWLPEPLCICAELMPLSMQTKIVLFIHHHERIKSSNTGRLVARMAPGTVVRVHGDPTRAEHPPMPEGPVFLLFPDPDAQELSKDLVPSGASPVLLVPDGTWQQTKRMRRRDQVAKDAVPVKLPEGQTTRYGLRRAAREGTLSTMEAVARALGILEGPEIEARMLATFDTFVARSMYVRSHGTLLAAPKG